MRTVTKSQSVRAHSVGGKTYETIRWAPWALSGALWLTIFAAGLWMWERLSYASIGESACSRGPIMVNAYECISGSAVDCFLDPQEARNEELYQQIHSMNRVLIDCIDARKLNVRG